MGMQTYVWKELQNCSCTNWLTNLPNEIASVLYFPASGSLGLCLGFSSQNNFSKNTPAPKVPRCLHSQSWWNTNMMDLTPGIFIGNVDREADQPFEIADFTKWPNAWQNLLGKMGFKPLGCRSCNHQQGFCSHLDRFQANKSRVFSHK